MARRPATTAAAKTPARQTSRTVRANRSAQARKLDTRRTLTAASGAPDPAGGTAQTTSAWSRGWQSAVFAYARKVPELGFAANYYANCFGRISLVPGLVGDNGLIQTAFDDEGQPVDEVAETAPIVSELLSTLRNRIGGQSALNRSAGWHLFLTGEGWLYGRSIKKGQPIDQAGPAVTYELLSVNELRPTGRGKYTRTVGVGGRREEIDSAADDVFIQRIYRPDEEYSALAWSTTQSCLDVLEELVILTNEVRATGLSRLNNGVTLVPDELDPPRLPAAGDPDVPPGDEEDDELIAEMVDYMMRPISDLASPAAAVPYMLRGPAEALKEFRHVAMVRPENAQNLQKRSEAIGRLACGIDLPPEVVLGHMNTTYANAFQISADRFQVHIEPALQIWVSQLSTGWLWPMLALRRGVAKDAVEAGEVPDEILRSAVFYDATRLVSHPDRSKEAAEAHKQFALADLPYLRAIGFDESDLPDDQEMGRRLNIERYANIRQTIRENVDTTRPPEVALSAAEIAKALAASGVAPAVIAAALGPSDTVASVERFALRLASATDVAVEAAVARLGGRLRAKVQGKTELRAAVDGIPNDEVAATLGPAVVGQLVGDDVWAGEFAALARRVYSWARDAGMGDAGDVAARCARLAEVAATRRLYAVGAPSLAEFVDLLAPPAVPAVPAVTAGR